MGDNTANQNKKEEVIEPDCESGSSLKPLRPVKPSENIAISENVSQHSEDEKIEKIHDANEEIVSIVTSEAKVEMFFEKPLEPSISENKKLAEKEIIAEVRRHEADMKPEQLSVEEMKVVTHEVLSKDQPQPTSVEKKNSERIPRNQSDIFSLKEQTSTSTAIFSINGSPSRKVFKRKEAVASNVFPFGSDSKIEAPLEKIETPKGSEVKECYSDMSRPSNTTRNPLTGTGLSSNDEYKCKGAKRKDGNPLLGLGYNPEATPSSHRIPPGGFSHKLW